MAITLWILLHLLAPQATPGMILGKVVLADDNVPLANEPVGAVGGSLSITVAGGPGFEPGLSGPEPEVLPLNYPPAVMDRREERCLA